MWLFTKYGFFSVVSAKDDSGQSAECANSMMIRTRLKSHLKLLYKRFPDKLATVKAFETPLSDYRFRIIVSKPIWAEIMVELSEEIDYDNFKESVASFQYEQSQDYVNSLTDVWLVMQTLQSTKY